MKAKHILLGVLCTWTPGWLPSMEGAFQLTDIAFWTGVSPGPGVNEAALVVDWNDGQTPYAWGFRWIGTMPKTGRDLLLEITAADPRLSVEGIASGFVSHFRLDLDLDGDAERFRPGWDGVANFWNYYVNNEVFEDPDNFANNGHIIPPATMVMPLGDPYAETDPGAWVASNTGVLDRPLADGGSITLSFDEPITDGAGPDFAVFENGFLDGFIELAFVEVSSDGLLFQRFPAVSLTPTDMALGSFGFIEASDIHNLAGKYRVGFGTPFDLQDLAGLAPPGVDLERIRFVRLVDVVGSLDPAFARLDSLGVPVNDPYPTPFPSGGFDLDAVAVLNRLPASSAEPKWLAQAIRREPALEIGEGIVYEVQFDGEPGSGVYQIERSGDLAAWTAIDDETIERHGDRWSLRVPLDAGAVYFRLRRAQP